MIQEFIVKKKQYLSEKKIEQRGSPEKKKIPAQASPPPPHRFSNGPSLNYFIYFRFGICVIQLSL